MTRYLMRPAAALLSLLGTAAADAAGQTGRDGWRDAGLEIGGVAWWLSPTVILRADANDVPGTTIDFVREFGVRGGIVPGIRAAWDFSRRHRVGFHVTPIAYSGNRERPVDLTFEGETFTGSEPASTRIQWNIWQLTYAWQPIGSDRGSLDVLGEIMFSDAEAAISGGGRTSFVTLRVPLPAFGLSAQRQLSGDFWFTGRLSGLRFLESFQLPFVGHLLDLDLSSTYAVADRIWLQAGYRLVDIGYTTSRKERRKAAVDEDRGSLTFRGPYIAAAARF